jgi:hypothetical protein
LVEKDINIFPVIQVEKRPAGTKEHVRGSSYLQPGNQE